MKIGVTLGQIRKSKGLVQKYVSEKSGISQTRLSLIESGKRNVSSDDLEKLLTVLNTDAKTILSQYLNTLEDADIQNDKLKPFNLAIDDILRLIETVLMA